MWGRIKTRNTQKVVFKLRVLPSSSASLQETMCRWSHPALFGPWLVETPSLQVQAHPRSCFVSGASDFSCHFRRDFWVVRSTSAPWGVTEEPRVPQRCAASPNPGDTQSPCCREAGRSCSLPAGSLFTKRVMYFSP